MINCNFFSFIEAFQWRLELFLRHIDLLGHLHALFVFSLDTL